MRKALCLNLDKIKNGMAAGAIAMRAAGQAGWKPACLLRTGLVACATGVIGFPDVLLNFSDTAVFPHLF
jgi:hypothetical protein